MREEINDLVRQHHGRSAALFGSVARGEDTPDSDIDFLIEFEPGSSLFDLMDLQEALEQLLGVPIDVVSVGGLKDRDDQIRREALPHRANDACRGASSKVRSPDQRNPAALLTCS